MQVRLGQYTYAEWIDAFEPKPSHRADLASAHSQWRCQPTVSIVFPVFNVEERFLRAALNSVLAQIYPHWQLCIADDGSTEPHIRKVLQDYSKRDSRIRVVYREHNGHIVEASNSALELATNDWVAFLDHDDRLHPHAFHFVAEAIATHPDVSLIYSDEDKIDAQDRRQDPYFKCDYNYELLLAYNMVCHLTVLRRSLVNDLGGLRRGFEGAQDYDLVLRATEHLSSDQILHLPRVLYHWRAHPGSTALSSQAKPYAAFAGRRAVEEHLQRRGIRATVAPAPDLPEMNRVRYALPDPAPTVSIVICTRDRADLLAACIDSIAERSTYRNYEVLVVDNGSTEAATFRLFERVQSGRVRVMRDASPFNFSALNNRAVRVASGDFVCLLNNDTEIITADWIEELLSFAAQQDVGAVGCRLWYPSGGLQHGGVFLGPLHVVHHAHRHLRRGHPGYFGRAIIHQSFSAVTGAALMIRKSLYDEVGGLDENLPVTFNDIDFCLRVRKAGYRNVWTPYAEIIHHECATRGADSSPGARARVEAETRVMKQRWPAVLQNDPAYSPNLSVESEDFRIAWPARVDGYQHVTPTHLISRREEASVSYSE
ncbi:MAG: glycosyltransferase family 2 protein [Burkholderiaceae bacterium]